MFCTLAMFILRVASLSPPGKTLRPYIPMGNPMVKYQQMFSFWHCLYPHARFAQEGPFLGPRGITWLKKLPEKSGGTLRQKVQPFRHLIFEI